jgi:hypothetical protein
MKLFLEEDFSSQEVSGGARKSQGTYRKHPFPEKHTLHGKCGVFDQFPHVPPPECLCETVNHENQGKFSTE